MDHIPIHEPIDPYAMAILVTWALGVPALTAHVHRLWFASSRVSLAAVHCCLMGMTVVFGFLEIPHDGPLLHGWRTYVFSLLLGGGLGFAATSADRLLVRFLFRRVWQRNSRAGGAQDMNAKTGALAVWARLRPSKENSSGSYSSRRRSGPEGIPRFGLATSLLAAVFEELIYRSLLLNACFTLGIAKGIVVAVFLSACMFPLQHIQFGWIQVFGKVPLGIMTLFSVLICGTVLPAVVAHCIVNIKAWSYLRDRAQVAAQLRY